MSVYAKGTVMACVVLFFAGGCASPPPEQEYRPTATVRELMKAMIDPSADGVWDSVQTVIDESGVHEKAPQTDEDWAGVRRHVVTLMEASNLLLVPGRHIAAPDEKADNPEYMLQPEEIEALVRETRDDWVKLTHGLHDAAVVALKSVEAKNPQALFDAGGGLFQACEHCHAKYWYPNKQQ
ncbi:MAG: hypothetical protein HY646_13665 [Acidobacteria bacterium]|nr:hypothetical protein [Acidobacteriota bacterium]